MPHTLRATINARLDVTESADSTSSPGSTEGGNTRTYNTYGTGVQLSSNEGSYPQIGGEVLDLSCTIGSGLARDFDLTSAPWAGNVLININKTGKKLVALELQCPITNNAAGITFGPQGANGYALFGASKTIILYPGFFGTLGYADPDQAAEFTVGTPAVAAGAKDLRWAGANGDVVKCKAIFSE
jgi:hypothetical protein